MSVIIEHMSQHSPSARKLTHAPRARTHMYTDRERGRERERKRKKERERERKKRERNKEKAKEKAKEKEKERERERERPKCAEHEQTCVYNMLKASRSRPMRSRP